MPRFLQQGQVSIRGLLVDNVTLRQAVDVCLELINRGDGAAVFTPNAEMSDLALSDAAFLQLLNQGDLVIPDGAGVVLASKLVGQPLQCKVAGIDLAFALLPHLERLDLPVYLFGGKPGVAQRAAETLLARHPKLRISGLADGYFTQDEQRVPGIAASGSAMVFVCLGSPKQERFIAQHKEQCGALMMGLGGVLDVLAGDVQRAPDFFIRHHLEWLYRAGLDPKRWRRMLRIPAFLVRVLRSR